MTLSIKRHFTKESQDGTNPALATITEKVVKAEPGEFAKVPENFLVPEGWATNAAKIFADKYLRRSGVPSATMAANEPGIPAFLQPSVPVKNAVIGGEHRVAQVMHRLAGAWTYHAFKRGYLDAENAQVFKDEVEYMLLHQIAAPNSPQFFNTGLHWAYGLSGPAQGHYRADPESGIAAQTTSAYEYPQVSACFIQSIKDDLVNAGGIMDLWLREARLFKYGSGTGSNFSALRAENESLSGGGRSSGMMSFLKIGDVSAGSIKSGGTTRRAAKMVIVDADHPDIDRFINWKADEELKVAALVAGSRTLAKHAKAVIAAIKSGNSSPDADPATNEPLKQTLRAARREGVPMGTMRPLLQMASEEIFDFKFPEFDTSFLGEAYATVSGQNANMSVRLTASFMKAVANDGDWVLVRRTDKKPARQVKARQLWGAINRAAWKSADPGLQFHDTINAWHTCKADGDIRASNPCSEYMFLDDTACNLASLNLRKFVNADGSFDVPGYLHAARLWTMVLDISVTMAQYPAIEIAERSHLYRTLGLGYANLGGLLMASGIPYDSAAGRTLCAALTALLTGEAYKTSAEMASVLGPFPRYEVNEHYMRVVINNHHAAAVNKPDQLLGFSDGIPGPVMLTPVEQDDLPLNINTLVTAAGQVWESVVADGMLYGFRNAQVSVLAPTGTIGLAMGCDTTGIEPDYALVKTKKLVGGDEIVLVNQCVESGLKAHGYSDGDRNEVLQWTKKHGTPEGCPALRIEHEAIFDCANRCSNGRGPHDPEYHCGTRALNPAAHVAMVAAAQSFISGAISKTVNMPIETTITDVAEIHLLAYRSGVKAIAIYRDNSKLSQPLMSGDALDTALGRDDEEPIVIQPTTPTYPRKPPVIRIGHTVKFGINGQNFYLNTNVYPDGMPAEIFITTSKEGAGVNTLFSTIARTFSTALQYGVPLEALVDQYLFVKSDPQGMVTDHPWIKNCTSPQDCIARHLAIVYLDRHDLAHIKPEADDEYLLQLRRSPMSNGNGYRNGPQNGHAGPNGFTNGHGHATGHSNGHTNSHANGHDNGHGNGLNGLNGIFPPLTAMAKSLAASVDAPYVEAGVQLALRRGFSGNQCANCGNYTLVRNGTCEKCETCGETSGCS